MRARVRGWIYRWRPGGPEYVPPSEWWPLISVCALLLAGGEGEWNPAAAGFGLFGALALVVYAIRWLHDREVRALRGDEHDEYDEEDDDEDDAPRFQPAHPRKAKR